MHTPEGWRFGQVHVPSVEESTKDADPLPHGGQGAGATLARGERAYTIQTPAASDVTAHGRGNAQQRWMKIKSPGGREAAAAFLLPCRAQHIT